MKPKKFEVFFKSPASDHDSIETEGYMYSEDALELIHKLAPCKVVQEYEDGSKSNEVTFEPSKEGKQ